MKKLILSLAVLCFAAPFLTAQESASADELFKKGDFAAALPLYQKTAQTAQGEALYTAQLRAAACAYMNGEYVHAAQMMMDYALPQDPLYKARFLLYRAHILQGLGLTYRRTSRAGGQPEREIDDEQAGKDVSLWTTAQRNRQINRDYDTLWKMRHVLINEPIEAQDLILTLKETDTQRIPTLFDFTLNQILQNLEQARDIVPLKTDSLLDGYAHLEPAQTTLIQRAELLREGFTLTGDNRANARLFWQTDFILLPFTYSGSVTFTDKEKALQKATAQLRELIRINPQAQKPSLLQRLKNRWLPAPTTDDSYGRAYAAEQLAQTLYEQDDYAQALEIARFAQDNFSSKFYYTDQCRKLSARILEKAIAFQTDKILNPAAPQLNVTARNSKQVFLRIYPITQEELRTYYQKETTWGNNNNLNYLSHISKNAANTILAFKTPAHELTLDWSYDKIYHPQTKPVTLPALSSGFYVLLASTNNDFSDKEPLAAGILNITDLALVSVSALQGDPDGYVNTLNTQATTKTAPLFHFYTINLKTGSPEPDTQLRIFADREKDNTSLKTDAQGRAALLKTFQWGNDKYAHFSAGDVLAQKGQSTAYTSTNYFSLNPNEPVRLFIQTDRAIYRPGQKMQLSANAFEVLPRGLKVLCNQQVTFKVRNTHYEEIFTAQVPLNDMGTAQTEMTLPENNTLLGSFTAEASVKINNRTYQTSHSFEVEEYKRPDYEVTLNAPDTPLALNKKGVVTGQARYYTGAPLANAKVKYTLSQKPYLPPFYWWCFFWQPRAEKIISESETTTDAQGKFSVPFTPELAQPKDEFVRYTLKADVLDDSGRPISTSRDYTIGTQDKLVKVSFQQGFYDANKPTPAFAEIDLTDTEGKSTTGTLSVRAVRLENKFDASQSSARATSSLEAYYQDAPEEQPLFEQKINFAQPGKQTLALPAAPAGIYRLTLQTPKGSAQHLVFIVADENAPLALPPVTLPQFKTYYAGQTARVLIGSQITAAPKYVLLFQQSDFLVHQDILAPGKSVYTFPVKTAYRGGIGLGWFAAGNYRLDSGKTGLEIPFDNKELAVKINVPAEVKPAQKVTWSLTARDKNNVPVNGQASVDVYDQSLDYYAKKHNPFTLQTLYPQQTAVQTIQTNHAAQHSNSFYPSRQTETSVRLLPLPQLNLIMHYRAYESNTKGAMMFSVRSAKMAVQNVDMEESMHMDTLAAPAMAMGVAAQNSAVSAEEDSDELSPQETSLRTNFAETAYFNTKVPVRNGKAFFAFSMPDALTTWNVLGFVLTREAMLGQFSASTISRKDVMVQLVLPRFLREGDTAVLQARVTNLSKQKISVPVTLDINDDNAQSRLAAFGIEGNTRYVEVGPNQTAFAAWEVTAPDGPALYQITAVGRVGQDSDGEQKPLPVLSGRSDLLATQNIALNNGENTLELPELAADKTAQAQTAALTLHPSLALSVLNDMPNLLAGTQTDLISSLARYTPLAVVHQFYTTYPELKEAVKKLPKRSSVSAPWNTGDPLRLTILEQTPWLLRSQGRARHAANIISLFDDKIVAQHLNKELQQIKKYQNDSGAFSWFAGGPDDDYLTLYALESFAQALAYNAQIPQEQAQKAYAYIVPRIEKRLREDKTGNEQNVSFALYAAYVLTSFPKHWSEVNKSLQTIQKWADYADEQYKFMTPLGQTYAAAVYHRLGDDIKANRYLDLVLSRMKEDKLTGAYFAPEAQSWLWYRDTLATQTTTLRTLLEIRPSSDKIDALTRWLLFNRHANEWDNSKSATQAVFTLLDVMKAKGALSAPVSYAVNWAGEQKTFNFEPFDWTEDLQLVKQGAQITPQAFRAQITKAGKMTDFASLSVVYSSAEAVASPEGPLVIKREYFLRFTDENNTPKLRPLAPNSVLNAGDEIEVHLTINTTSAFEYVAVNDPKPTGFESDTLLSRWTYNPVSMYEEVRDAQTNFFVNWLPAGTITLKYVLRPTTSGVFRVLPAQVQSIYAPEFGAHTASGSFEVNNK